MLLGLACRVLKSTYWSQGCKLPLVVERNPSSHQPHRFSHRRRWWIRQFLALDDEIVRTGLGPDKATKVAALGDNGNLDHRGAILRGAQRKIERRHFRDRMMLLHHEKERKKVQREMGQDPYLDTPD